jgi:hypothetical protein
MFRITGAESAQNKHSTLRFAYLQTEQRAVCHTRPLRRKGGAVRTFIIAIEVQHHLNREFTCDHLWFVVYDLVWFWRVVAGVHEGVYENVHLSVLVRHPHTHGLPRLALPFAVLLLGGECSRCCCWLRVLGRMLARGTTLQHVRKVLLDCMHPQTALHRTHSLRRGWSGGGCRSEREANAEVGGRMNERVTVPAARWACGEGSGSRMWHSPSRASLHVLPLQAAERPLQRQVPP